MDEKRTGTKDNRQKTIDGEESRTGRGGVSETALREEEVLAFWKERDIFAKSLAKESPKGEFVFYDGPPFATGLPHVGHLLGSSIKDVVGRYKTMRGYHVPRRWGWDTHGLPVENIVEKKLEITDKKGIEALGVERFNVEARKTVLAYVDDWRQYIERIGRWVDFDHSYKTMDNSYIESVWWALKKIYDDKRLYEGKKVLMYCPHCETPLSKAEIAMDNSYKDVTEDAVYVKFGLDERKEEREKRKEDDVRERLGVPDDGKPIYMVAWTTTPWTLPGNVALAVNKNEHYVLWKTDNAYYIAEMSLATQFLTDVETSEEFMGSDLVGLAYEPLYDVPRARAAEKQHAWKILPADFVTTEEGTGIVHIAPMYGEDDYELGRAYDLPLVQLLDSTGTYTTDAPELVRGMYYKKGGKYVMEDLEKRDLLFKKHPHTHSYPHCYRCGTALIYNALTSWFIDVQSVKERLLAANEDVAWYPEHLKHGRFRNIVEGAPDWTISRNRFWASPLPIWKHEKTGEVVIIGSLEALRMRTKKSGNRYFTMRHGHADSNDKRFISSCTDDDNHLTEVGRENVYAALKDLKGYRITRIITSPLVRTRETADIVADGLGIPRDAIIVEDRFKEWQLGVLSGEPLEALRNVCASYEQRFRTACAQGAETLSEMKQRIGAALYDLEEHYHDEGILIVGHEYTAWLAECVARGADVVESIRIRGSADDYVMNAEVRRLDFVPLPHDEQYELDLHRPYIDVIPLVAEDGARLTRIPEVVDCWVESGLMPVAAEHRIGQPFCKPDRYPGDFIAEYIAQTRTWFYYMHTMGVLLFDAPSFRHCVSTGTILAEDGSKMSKSKGNFTDPLVNLDRFGADALRLYLLGSVVMQSEDMNFRDEELRDVHNRFIGTLWNTYKFYELYAGEEKEEGEKRKGTHKPLVLPEDAPVLDRWIVSRLSGVVRDVTTYLDMYDTVRAVRVLRDFVTDLSTWYIRRSRDRFKGEDAADRKRAIVVTREVLTTLARVLAPLAPFLAERIYRGVGGEGESVHLAPWPEAGWLDEEVLVCMAETRDQVISPALELRARAGVKIRQPLQALTVPTTCRVYEDLVRDELNVKEILRGEHLALDTTLTPALEQEGAVRELVRMVQDLRKQAKLLPEDRVVLTIATEDGGKAVVEAARGELTRVAGVSSIAYLPDEVGTPVICGGVALHLALRRA